MMDNEDMIVKTILFEGQVAGYLLSWNVSGEQDVGYWLGKEFWGKGIATKALAEFLGLREDTSAGGACRKAQYWVSACITEMRIYCHRGK